MPHSPSLPTLSVEVSSLWICDPQLFMASDVTEEKKRSRLIAIPSSSVEAFD